MKCNKTDVDNIILLIDEKLKFFKNSLFDGKVSQDEKRKIINTIGHVMKDLEIDFNNSSMLFQIGINKEDTDILLSDIAKQYKLRKDKLEEKDNESCWILHNGKKSLQIYIVKEKYYDIEGDSWNGSAFSYEELENFVELWVQGVFDAEQEVILNKRNN